jgi:hypothetical protein
MAFVLLSSPLSAETPAKEPVHTTKTKTTTSTQQKTTTTGNKSANTTNTQNDYPTSGASIVGNTHTTGTPVGLGGTSLVPANNTANTLVGNITNANRSSSGTTGGLGTTGNTLGGNASNGNVVNTQMNTLDVLREARDLVSRVPYTYDGHREQANRDISQAIHKLTPPRPPNPQPQNSIAPTAPHSGGSSQPGLVHTAQTHVMSQAAAEARLQHAMKLLSVLHKQVQEENEAAAVDVEAAITELKLALKGD